MMKFEFTKGQIERLLETYNVKDIDKLLNENVVGSVIGRFFGKKLVSTLESRYGDDIIIILDRLFANAESRGSIITGVDKKLYLIAGNNKKWSMETIKNAINAVASGKLPPDTLDLLPKTLKDGSTFRETLQNQLSRVKPKTAPKSKPKTTPKTTETPNTGIVGTSLTDDVIVGSIKEKFNELGIPYKLTAKQESFFISELRTLTNEAYEQIRKGLPENFNETALRFKSLPPSKQREIIIQAQKVIKENTIGVGMTKKQLIKFNEGLEKILDLFKIYKGDKVKDKLLNFLIFNASLTVIDILINSIQKGKITSENVFGFSWKQQALWKVLTSAVLSYGNIGKKLNIIYSLVMATYSLTGKDKSEQLSDFPISILEAKEFIESSSNPLELDPDERVTKYEPVDKDLKPMNGEKGAFIKVYVDKKYLATVQKDITGKIKLK
jgi:hypothetical protein